jgi:hypothetical protein
MMMFHRSPIICCGDELTTDPHAAFPCHYSSYSELAGAMHVQIFAAAICQNPGFPSSLLYHLLQLSHSPCCMMLLCGFPSNNLQ